MTLGTTPQGQSHETTAAQVVADILGCSVDDVNVRAGHDSYWNSHAGFSGTYASQFAVTGLGAVKGATEELAGQMRKLAAVVLGEILRVGHADLVFEKLDANLRRRRSGDAVRRKISLRRRDRIRALAVVAGIGLARTRQKEQ